MTAGRQCRCGARGQGCGGWGAGSSGESWCCQPLAAPNIPGPHLAMMLKSKPNDRCRWFWHWYTEKHPTAHCRRRRCRGLLQHRRPCDGFQHTTASRSRPSRNRRCDAHCTHGSAPLTNSRALMLNRYSADRHHRNVYSRASRQVMLILGIMRKLHGARLRNHQVIAADQAAGDHGAGVSRAHGQQ